MTNEQTNNAPPTPEFTIQRVYVKDLSLECPQSPQVFQEEWQPELNLQFAMNTSTVAETIYELILQITVTATSKEKTLFLIEIKQAGLFTLKGFTEEQIQQVLSITCPTILFPYAREAVSDLVGRAGFPPLYLAPVNFEALYMQQMQEQGEKEGGGTSKKANSKNSIITH
ncbi:protein-export protein SecB [Candidatus Rickettsiella viridis]|uniref:Protein-export protein SecB n=1 Tax=Candidatus Rickettsiella viridis TaxID=676208 RepID=A0A2Z5UUJ5_9COXI|nr:protein-export chaperone SecB [Candidatus Rickettsiella viridis]BBB14623.1 protein-export protein SecB [Candidatus Rickettsiella viridis]